MVEKCIFCKVVKGEIPSEKIYENSNFFSMKDVNPVALGHSLIIPKEHFKTSLDIPDNLGLELLDCIKKTAVRIIEETKADGFNIIGNNFESAGQVIEHAHFHIIPRKKGDNLKGKLIV